MKNRFALLVAVALGVGGCCHQMCHKHEEKHEEKDEGNEMKVSMDQVPPAAKATLMHEAMGNPIGSVDKEMRKGMTVYEADVKMNGTNWEIVVGSDGKLISKKVDNEEDEKK